MTKPVRTIFIASATEDASVMMLVVESIINANHSKSAPFFLQPVPWNKTEWTLNQANLHSIIEFPKKYDYGCFLFTPTDTVISRNLKSFRVRDNVIFEFGLFVSQNDGLKKSFIIHPDESNLKLASDLSGIVTAKYFHSEDQQSLSTNIGIAVETIFKAVEKHENEKIERSEKAVSTSIASLRAKLQKTKATQQPEIILNALKDLAETKAQALNQTTTEVLKDIIIWTNTLLDITDPDDLAKLQRDDLKEVWVYSSMPIEFDANLATKELNRKFKETVISNLEKAVKYIYFIDSEKNVGLIRELSDLYPEKIEVYILEPYCVTSNYVFHFYKDDSTSIFQNIVRKGVLESLVKLDKLDAELLIGKIKSQFEKFKRSRDGNLWINRRVTASIAE
jgi:hypothetical protein